MDWDVGALFEDTDKLRNFVEYEQGRSFTIVVAGRLKSHIQFWRSTMYRRQSIYSRCDRAWLSYSFPLYTPC